MSWRSDWLMISLRSLVYAISSAVFALPLAAQAGVLGASVGAVLGVILAYAMAHSRLRLIAVIVVCVFSGLILSGLTSFITNQFSLAEALGSRGLLNLREATFWLIASTSFAVALAFLALRIRALVAFEVAVVISVFSQLVAAHRFGAIHRPFELADPILVRGGDPSSLLLVVGAVAAILMAALLIKERRLSRLLGQIVLLSALVLLALFASQRGGIFPHPKAPDSGLGLRGDLLDADRVIDKSNNDWAEQLDFRDSNGGSGFPTPVAVVLFHDDYSPPGGYYYFRQGTFSQFNGRRLVVSTRDDIDLDVAKGFSPVRSEVGEVPEFGTYRTSLDTTVALMVDHTRPFALESAVSFTPTDNPNPDRFRRAYRAQSRVITSKHADFLSQKAGAQAWSEEQWSHYLQIPDDSRYSELGQQIVAQLPPELSEIPMLRANSVQRWLAKQGIYSLNSKHSNAPDPTAHFLFGDKIGYCVHFAHAATYILRSLGIPTRVGSGYKAAESARQGGSALLLTSADAHAWPEIYLRDVGWVVVDIQPERNIDPPGTVPDAELQRLLGQLARGSQVLPEEGEVILSSFASLWRWLNDRFGKMIRLALIAGILFCYSVKAWRTLRPVFVKKEQQPRLLYRRQLDRLSELGWRRNRGESREGFALRLKDRLPSLIKLTDAHVAAAFGSQREVAPDLLRATANDVRAQLRTTVPLYRRMLGWLIPWSWMTSR
jgi:transglutaminase-like putative cysteine protease